MSNPNACVHHYFTYFFFWIPAIISVSRFLWVKMLDNYICFRTFFKGGNIRFQYFDIAYRAENDHLWTKIGQMMVDTIEKHTEK